MPLHGRNTKVLVDEYDLSRYFRDASVSSTSDLTETTSFGSSDKEFILGWVEGTLSLGGMFEATTQIGATSADTTDAYLRTVLGQDGTTLVTWAPNGFTVGNRVTVAEAREVSYDVSSPISDVISVTADFQGDGPVRSGIALHDLSEETAGGNSTSVDNSASSANGGIGQLHVTDNDRNGAVVVKIQHSTDNSVWADLITFASVTAATKAKERLSVTGTVNRYVRALWTVAGSSGGATFTVVFVRK